MMQNQIEMKKVNKDMIMTIKNKLLLNKLFQCLLIFQVW
jgi:hypothetical protein